MFLIEGEVHFISIHLVKAYMCWCFVFSAYCQIIKWLYGVSLKSVTNNADSCDTTQIVSYLSEVYSYKRTCASLLIWHER